MVELPPPGQGLLGGDERARLIALILGFDADPIGRDGSGNETYLRGLMDGLARCETANVSVVLAGSNLDALSAVGKPPQFRAVRVPRGILGELGLGRVLRAAGADVAVGHYNVPLGFGGPRATIVHDVAFRDVPDTFPKALRARIEASVYLAARKSDIIVTVSEFSKSAICRTYAFLDPERVIVTNEAPADLFFEDRSEDTLRALRDRYSLPETFVLGVGNVQPRKNFIRLAQATKMANAPLVLVGQQMWRHREVLAGIDSHEVRILGYVPAEELACLYRLCTVFAYPSLYEGYGLPVIEAMASGAPVVTSNGSSLPEVSGGAAICVDPLDIEAIAGAIRSLIDDVGYRHELSRRATAWARGLSWQQSAATLVDAICAIIPA